MLTFRTTGIALFEGSAMKDCGTSAVSVDDLTTYSTSDVYSRDRRITCGACRSDDVTWGMRVKYAVRFRING